MEPIAIALAVSIVLNVVLLAFLGLHRVRSVLTASAMSDLLERIKKLEETTRTPQKIVIVDQKQQGEA